MATSNLSWQNKFSTTLSSGISASDTTIPLTNLPTPTEGYLVIEPDSSTAWEEIYYTSKTGSAVIVPSALAGRGQGGSSAASHAQGATVRMDTTAEMFKALQDGTAFPSGTISPVGSVVQMVQTDSAATTSGSIVLPADNTIPQNTEGFEVMTQAITPKATGNLLLVVAHVLLSANTSTRNLSAALFQDSTGNAITGVDVFQTQSGGPVELNLRAKVTAASTSSTTFRVRIGSDNGGTTVTFGAGLFGGIPHSSINVTEVKS